MPLSQGALIFPKSEYYISPLRVQCLVFFCFLGPTCLGCHPLKGVQGGCSNVIILTPPSCYHCFLTADFYVLLLSPSDILGF